MDKVTQRILLYAQNCQVSTCGHIDSLLLQSLEQAGACDGPRHHVGVTVGRRAPVLEVAALRLPHLPRDADAGPAVGHARGEVVDMGGLVQARQTPPVVLSSARVVHQDVCGVVLAQLLYGLLNVSAAQWADSLIRS